MHDSTTDDQASTTWVWKRVKIRRPPNGQDAARAQRGRWWGLPPRQAREPISIKVSYRSGPEAWYEVHARGRTVRVPGYTALHDLMRDINGYP